MSQHPVVVVGIGADGWPGLAGPSRAALIAAEVVLGGPRQLDLLPADVTAERVPWPSPLVPALPGLLESHARRHVAVLASGDPMWFGIGATLARLVGRDRFTVLPHPSSVSLACARLGWPVESVTVVSTVGRPLAPVAAALAPGRRVLVLTSTPATEIADMVTARGYGASRLVLLTQLGGPDEAVTEATAAGWRGDAHDPLAVVAVECVADAGVEPLPLTPGRRDDAFDHDGQITKWEIRAITLAALAPLPGQLLWDVGAGSGSVAVEWLRAHPANRAVAVEPRADRRERIAANAETFGVTLDVVAGSAPDALAGLPAPDAIFVGGGVSVHGVLDACVAVLRPGGRLVANGVTVETEVALADARRRLGGSLLRLAVERAEPLGGFTGWTPARTVTQWSLRT